jgi:hypothetical protein
VHTGFSTGDHFWALRHRLRLFAETEIPSPSNPITPQLPVPYSHLSLSGLSPGVTSGAETPTGSGNPGLVGALPNTVGTGARLQARSPHHDQFPLYANVMALLARGQKPGGVRVQGGEFELDEVAYGHGGGAAMSGKVFAFGAAFGWGG